MLNEVWDNLYYPFCELGINRRFQFHEKHDLPLDRTFLKTSDFQYVDEETKRAFRVEGKNIFSFTVREVR